MDLFQSSEDVLRWLEQAGFSTADAGMNATSLRLLGPARRLRENIRMLMEKRKAGRRGDGSILNEFLAEAHSFPQLVWKRPGSLKIDRVRKRGTPKAILAPIAEAAAELLATADFNLVKRCEDESLYTVVLRSDQIAPSSLVQYAALREPPQGRRVQEATP